MPKENVYCASNRDENPQLSWRAELQWTGEKDDNGFVTLGTVNPKSEFHHGMLTGEDRTVTVQSADGKSGEVVEHPTFDGYYVTLDRHGINRLIRALRRARDQAYGADA